MQVQTNTDHHVEGKDSLAAHVEETVEKALRHVRDHITRVEVHLKDEDAGKRGVDDKRCLMEARPRNHQPVAVSHHAGSIHQAIDGAARKLRSALEKVLGRLEHHDRHRVADAVDSEEPAGDL